MVRGWTRGGRVQALPPRAASHTASLPCPWSVTSSLAHPETRGRPSSPQEGQPEDVEMSGSQEAPGSGHSSAAEQQPIYFR
jgi:hypothetical protein